MKIESWLIRSLLILLIGQTTIQAVRPAVSYRALELGASPAELGLIAAAFPLLPLLLAVPLGRWIDRWGEPPFLIVAATLFVVGAVALARVDSLLAVAAAQVVLGIGHVQNAIGLQTIVSNAGRVGQRDARIGAYTVVGAVAQVIGPSSAGLLIAATGGSVVAVFGASIFTSLACLGLAVSLQLFEPREHERRGKAASEKKVSTLAAIGRVVRTRTVPQVLFMGMSMNAIIDMLVVFLPAYGEARGIAVTTVGYLLSVRAAATIASRLALVPLIRIVGRERLLVTAGLTTGVSIALVGTTASIPLLTVLLAIAGLGVGVGAPVVLSWLVARIPVTERGTAIGIRITGNRLMQVTTPTVTGTLFGASGFAAGFVLLGALPLAASVLLFKHRKPSDEPTMEAP